MHGTYELTKAFINHVEEPRVTPPLGVFPTISHKTAPWSPSVSDKTSLRSNDAPDAREPPAQPSVGVK